MYVRAVAIASNNSLRTLPAHSGCGKLPASETVFQSAPTFRCLHLNRGHEAVDAPPHPNGSAKASRFDLNIDWDGLTGDTKGIYGLFRGWLAKGLEGRTCS